MATLRKRRGRNPTNAVTAGIAVAAAVLGVAAGIGWGRARLTSALVGNYRGYKIRIHDDGTWDIRIGEKEVAAGFGDSVGDAMADAGAALETKLSEESRL